MTLTIHDFFDKFSTDTTTNFQLIKWARDLGFKIHYAMRDEIKDLKKKKKLPIFIISNYHTSIQEGIHHVAIYKNKDISYYFDSFGIQPFKEVIDFLDTNTRFYSSFQIQKANTKICGVLCLFVLYKLSQKEDFFDIILNLKNELQYNLGIY